MLFMTLCSLPRDGWQSYEYAVSKPRQISYFFHSFSISNAYIGGGHWASGCHGTTTNVTTMCFWYQCILWDNDIKSTKHTLKEMIIHYSCLELPEGKAVIKSESMADLA